MMKLKSKLNSTYPRSMKSKLQDEGEITKQGNSVTTRKPRTRHSHEDLKGAISEQASRLNALENSKSRLEAALECYSDIGNQTCKQSTKVLVVTKPLSSFLTVHVPQTDVDSMTTKHTPQRDKPASASRVCGLLKHDRFA